MHASSSTGASSAHEIRDTDGAGGARGGDGGGYGLVGMRERAALRRRAARRAQRTAAAGGCARLPLNGSEPALSMTGC